MASATTVNRGGRVALIALAAIFVVAAYVRGVLPMREAARGAIALTDAVALLSEVEGDLDTLHGQIEAVGQAIGETERRLPPEAGVDTFLADAGRIAGRLGVSIEQLTPGEIHRRSLYHEQRVLLRASGPFPGIYDFVKGMEEGPRLVRIDRLTLDGTTPGTRCVAELEVCLFFQPAGGVS